MDLAVTTKSHGPGANQGFIVKPSDITEVGGTIDLAKAGASIADNAVPAGTLLARVTASGNLGTYDNTATDGRQTCVGVLFDSIPTRGKTAGNVGCAVIVLGAIYGAKLPVAPDAAAKADIPSIVFV